MEKDFSRKVVGLLALAVVLITVFNTYVALKEITELQQSFKPVQPSVHGRVTIIVLPLEEEPRKSTADVYLVIERNNEGSGEG